MWERPGLPRLLVLLLGVAGAVDAPTRLVNGVAGGSVLLSPDLPLNGTEVKEVEWAFTGVGSVTRLVAEFGRGGFERPDPQDRFGERLEMPDGSALRIRRLERGDSGDYEVRLKLHPAVLKAQKFTLSVYDPLPEPKIRREQLSLSPRQCNLTLRCQPPPGTNATVSWHPGTPPGQPCGDSQTLCLALPLPAFNSIYTCVARGPAQERNASVHPHTLCPQQGTRSHAACLVLVGAVGAAALPGIAWICCRRRRRRRRKKKPEGGVSSPGREEGIEREETAPGSGALAPPELLYAQIQRGNPREPREGQEQPRTIYCELRAKV
ncbi:T-cell surface antigen CD2-like isoform X4 [Myiozetetes cayanensis]|uniref:T-cell surface antigen CD2-like isoform X4 n=1 Tax=Myiozetetes cayanensis TaxID=478635 RepID=UPI00215F7605|nr:T-cell surface antigen CD2-like isoform X4 [Myiozetetes cayanensis]